MKIGNKNLHIEAKTGPTALAKAPKDRNVPITFPL